MEFERKKDSKGESVSHDSNIYIIELIAKYLRYWKWFALSVFLILLLTYYNLNFARKQYQIESSIKIKNENRGDQSTLSVFQDLGIAGGVKNNVDDQIEILQSKTLISETIKSLNLNIAFYTDKNKISDFMDSNVGFGTHYYENERYLDPPLKINFFLSDSAIYKVNSAFLVHVKSDTDYTMIDIESSAERNFSFGERVTSNFGDIILTPNLDLKKNNLIGNTILVTVRPILDLTNSYQGRLSIEPVVLYSNVLKLTLVDSHKSKGEDFLNELIKRYNQRTITLKEELTKTTSDFVNKRLAIISDELLNVDLTAESLKTRYRISDVASETGLNMQSGQDLERRIVTANTELAQVKAMKEFVSDNSSDDFIPANVGINDNNVKTATERYNELLLDKKRLLKTSTEKNPIVVNINEQLETLKENIGQGLDNIENAQQINLEQLNRQDAIINSRLYSAPRQEREIRDVRRQQQIKEQLYLYLLQKREETAITLGVAEPNAEIIDYAVSRPSAVAPKKMLSYLGSMIMGLLIPIILIYLVDLLDSKIHTKEDVEKILDVPIIGDIPKFESSGKKRYLISSSDYSGVAEAFRILRTNLKFILPSKSTDDGRGKTIFITSTIAHEGKSLVATNLAAALAFTGKKTLLLGLDIRAPKIEPYLKVKHSKGITNYVINHSIDIEDITVEVPNVDNLDVIFSGDLAPNPAELLMNPRITSLFEYARENYEHVVVDTAAFSMVTDTMLLSSFADAFIYVIRANYLDKRALKYINSLYTEKRLQNMAVLLNGVDHKKAYGYGYGYGYGTAFNESQKKPWWKFI